MLIEMLATFQKVKTENLKFTTYLEKLCRVWTLYRSVEVANFKAHLQNGSWLYSPIAQEALQHCDCNTNTALVTLHMIILSSRINADCSKNVEKENQSLSSQFSLYMAFHLQPIWLKTLVAINLASCQRLFPTFCSQPSEVAVLFDWNLSRHPF